MGFGEPKMPTPKEMARMQKIEQKESEIISNTPKENLQQITQDLKWYLKYREKDDEARKYPSNMDLHTEVQDMIEEDFDLWDSIHEQYGWTPEDNNPKWKTSEIAELVKKLESK